MGSKDKGGRETRKPKKDKKVKGQTPAPSGSVHAATETKPPGHK